MEKAVNVEAKVMFQSSSSTCDMDLRCPRGNRSAKKEEKNFSRRNKSTNSPFADMSNRKQSSFTQQTSSANLKKDQDHQQGGFWRRGGRQRQGHSNKPLAMGVNAGVIKKKVKDVSQVECYYSHQKLYYAIKCPQELKNSCQS